MRRKSERAAAASKKVKQSPEKKVEKAKRTRSRRSRKQSSSSENESPEETSPVREKVVVEAAQQPPTTPVKEPSPEETQEQEQVWHVKAPQTSGDGGEIQKLKICLTRPPSTPERADRSPRSKRKHSRATSSSDTPSNEGSEEKKKRHRSKRSSTRESKDESDKNQDSQGDEPEVECEVQEAEVEQESKESKAAVAPKQDAAGDNVPMSTTSEEVSQPPKTSDTSTNQEQEETNKEGNTDKPSEAADTTVSSPKADSDAQDTSKTSESEEKQQSMRERSESIDKCDLLELHPEEAKCESMDLGKGDEEKKSAGNEKVSISEDKKSGSRKRVSESKSASNNATNENDVVERSERVANERSRRMSVDSDKDGDGKHRNKKVERSDSIQSTHEEPACNGQSAPIVINRKRKWGSRTSKLTTQKSITISTDVLKDIIPDVKPAEFDEVIDEKRHRRVEVSEKLERPVLPKIVIDNTESVEQHKKDQELNNTKETRENNLSINRKISIVNDENIARPPSPPRNKQSNILYITNLVRPFTLPQLKNLLQRTGRIAEDGFWIDRIKSKCYVKYENEDQAVETRHALHGVTWPVSNPKVLQVDFSTQEAFDKAKSNEETDNAQTSTIPGTVEDWLREQDQKRQRGEVDLKPWERKAAMREWDVGKNDKDKEREHEHGGRKDDRLEKRRHHIVETSPEPAKKFKKKEEEAPAKLLDDLFRKTKATPCIYWLPLSAETIAVKEEQRRQHMAEHERRMQEMRRTHRDRDRRH